MSGNSGTKIVRDGLVLCLDAANPKSYPGYRSNPVSGTWYDVTKGDIWLDTDCNGVFTSHSASDGFLFDGISDSLEQYTGFSSTFDATTNINGDVTAEAWFKISAFNSNNYSCLFIKGTTNRLYGLFYRSIGFLYQRLEGGVSTMNCEYASAPQLDTWYHMAGTSVGTNNHILYLNGVQVQTSSTSVSVPALANSVRYRIGYYTPSLFFHNGYIANVKLYNRALSAEEVLQNFNAHRGRFGI
jgi:hypothetical protein